MILIIVHHYVVNSGLFQIIQNTPQSISTTSMLILGGWGKVGINCFVMITGYYMCKSKMSVDKLVKLYLQITFYSVIIYTIFCFTGHEQMGLNGFIRIFIPVHGLTTDFVSCFLVFYLFIPFINIFLSQLSRKTHLTLIVFLSTIYIILPSIPKFYLTFNYFNWFIVVYLIGSYIRLYGLSGRISHRMWGLATIVLIIFGSLSVFLMEYLYKIGYTTSYRPYFFIIDSNKLLAILPAITSFMYFKDLRIPHSRFINALGSATFGVLLIHANSNAMRQWLWKETVDCIGHFGFSALWNVAYALSTSLIIFFVCAGIDWFRGRFLEPTMITYFTKALSRIRHKMNSISIYER
ncbi:MAG: acyltransferase [Muribaculaceae bacterium]|nr:acyltransferase [Muribaculaceae bacterium]